MLEKFKYFGVRFIYYRIKRRFPYLQDKSKDVLSQNILSRAISKKIIREYGGLIGHGATEREEPFLGLGLIHYSMIRNIKPERILCLGSYRGFIPAICAMACEDNGKGFVDFVDKGVDLSDKNKHLGDGFWRTKEAKGHFEPISPNKRIKTYVMDIKEFVNKCPDRTYDYIYIDADHRYESVKKDYKLLWPKLKKKGYMLFHDILGEGLSGVEFGVRRLWKELPDKRKLQINFPKETGLGILQK